MKFIIQEYQDVDVWWFGGAVSEHFVGGKNYLINSDKDIEKVLSLFKCVMEETQRNNIKFQIDDGMLMYLSEDFNDIVWDDNIDWGSSDRLRQYVRVFMISDEMFKLITKYVSIDFVHLGSLTCDHLQEILSIDLEDYFNMKGMEGTKNHVKKVITEHSEKINIKIS